MPRTSDILEIGQAIYGSESGIAHFQTLAASRDLTTATLHVFHKHSNINQSAHESEDTHPVYCYYPVDTGRGLWAFSRTVFLSPTGRGKDYLAHALFLDLEILEVMRGDLFLLEDELHLFSHQKPTHGHLEPIPLSRREMLGLSDRPCGSTTYPAWTPTSVLRALAGGTTALPVEDGKSGAELCRVVLSWVPPADRVSLSFCSRFIFPRRVSLRMAGYFEEDRRLVQQNLDPFASPGPEAPGGGADLFDRWHGQVVQGLAPLPDVSVLQNPRRALAAAEGLNEWRQRILDPSFQPAPELVRLVALDPSLSGLRALSQHALVLDAGREVEEILAQDRIPSEAILAIGEKAIGKAALVRPNVEEFATLAKNHAANSRTPHALVAALAVHLANGGADTAVGRPNGFWPTPAKAAQDLMALFDSHPRGVQNVCESWLRRWKATSGPDCLSEVAKVFRELNTRQADEAVRRLLSGVEEAGASDPHTAGEWARRMLDELRPVIGDLFAPGHAARLILKHELLADRSDNELHELAPIMINAFPDGLLQNLSSNRLPPRIVIHLLDVCGEMLYISEATLLEKEPQKWYLTALALTEALLDEGDEESECILEILSRMRRRFIWEGQRGNRVALRTVEPVGFSPALKRLGRRPPRQAAAVVARVAWGWEREGLGRFELTPAEFGNFRAAVLAELEFVQEKASRVFVLKALRDLGERYA